MKDIFRIGREAAEAGAWEARLAALNKAVDALRNLDRDRDAYLDAARCYEGLRDYESALKTLRRGVERCPPSARLYRRYIARLYQANRISEAIESAWEAILKFPSDFSFRLQHATLLPILYADSDEMERYRRRFAEGLREIAEDLRLDTAEARRSALQGLDRHHILTLAYQGQDDREVQTLYSEMVHRIAAANYPQWVQPMPMPPDNGRLRVGYVSSRWYNHSVSRTHLGWLEAHSQDRFEVFAYHAGSRTDDWTEDARRASAVFRHLPDDMEEACRAIVSDRLHVLVFLEIGRAERMTQLAALRLAPVQCTTWGDPVTSGLPTVDYYLSGDLMEPEDAQNYYTEKLVRLPGIGVYLRKPVIPTVGFYRTRADFGIRDDAVVYLSCQSPAKYLPQHDDVFPAIAKLVPGSQFVFIARNDALRHVLQRRLERAFSSAGVPISGRVVFVPRLDTFNYWNLNVVSDIYLDTMDWSGCNSTLDAIACKLPVVTLPGRFMRGRHSSAILTQAGATETIARDPSGYVGIAAKLGLDRDWRERIVRRLIAGYPTLYADERCVRALEDFYRDAVNERRTNPNATAAPTVRWTTTIDPAPG